MPQICKLCTYPDQAAVKAAFATDISDRELARRFNVSAMAVGRHRRAHLVAPLRAAVAALDRGREVRQQRADQSAAIAQADPVAIAAAIGLPAQIKKLEAIEARLERMAAVAEAGQSPASVATLSAQQLRGVEVGSRLAGTGAYAPQRGDQAGAGPSFSVQIVFSGGQTETFTTSSRPVIDSAEFQDRSDDQNMDQGEDPGEDPGED